ncbi:MAG: thiamine pyrophosphate-dependent dehydrogenase E1 component subunit alpha [Anaerolineae bacterium]|nr:thiamine pyrophosphate-dependent dehydrogenase E1 component subunit alpha [Anaerolineae bacterium]
MLKQMQLIRAFEEKADELFALGKVHGTMHLSIGQEAVAVGAMACLRPDDYILSTHRGHGHCIARGADPKLMLAEFMGKETGYCRGRGGSMHIADPEMGNLGANGVVGGGISIAMGVALAVSLRKTDQVVLGFFGDGAANLGIFHESLNMASIWHLPVVYICENNQYGMSMSVKRALSVENVADRAVAYNMPGTIVDGNDVLAVYKTIREAVSRARQGDGPSLIEAKTYRWKGHSKSDQERYRTREEVNEWKQKCPIKRFSAQLIAKGIPTLEAAEQMEAEVHEEIQAALEFAEASPEPRVEDILEGVYA